MTSKLDKKRNLFVQFKNRKKQIDNFQLFETNHRNLFYTKETLMTTEQNFSPTNLFQTDLRDKKLDQLFLWDFRGMFENQKQKELLICHIATLQRAMILMTPINGIAHQIFLNKQNALGTHAERAGGILYVHSCAKVIVHVFETRYVPRKYQLGCLLTTVQKELDTWTLYLEYSIETSHYIIATPCTRTLLNCRMGHG